MRLLGICREKENSPGRHLSNDALVLAAVADRLRERDLAVDVVTIDRAHPHAAIIFSMCQGRAALDRLTAWERGGAVIVNSPRGALNTYRNRLPDVMKSAGVPYPATRVIATDDGALDRATVRAALDAGRTGVWLKRGDVHASVSQDVQWVDSSEALEAGFADFRARGIRLAAVQAHRAGDEIKFYGVGGTGFFHWFYTGEPAEYPFDPVALQQLAARAAAAAGVEIYGGDMIVSATGDLTLIDLNDWPSFAPCREAAAESIADYLTRRVHAAWSPGLVPSADQSAV